MNESRAADASLTVDDLNSVREAYGHVLWCRRRLLEAKDASGVHGVNYDKVGGGTPNYKSHLENDALRVVRREQKLRLAELEMEAAQLRLLLKLFVVNDSRTRLILVCRYVDLMDWKHVSAEIGGGEINSPEAVKKAHQRFINRLNRENRTDEST